ncbi:MAG: MotA/TolQ/ExbB proton channel family protein [Betaproteobacteria bacterium]|nr:MotA/TolQ/ExbB proton channel family protein [Betaproteobacteria bacterium]
MSLLTFWLQGDWVIRFVALALLALSVSTWVVIVWKWAVLQRVQHDVPQSIAAFWQAAQFDDALQKVAQFDRDQCVKPMLDATVLPLGGTLAAAGEREHQLTRVLRDSMQATVRRLQWGQLMLVAGPVGEALVMTAAGLAVAIPAVLAYNVLGRKVAHIEIELEGFAQDLLNLLTGRQR